MVPLTGLDRIINKTITTLSSNFNANEFPDNSLQSSSTIFEYFVLAPYSEEFEFTSK